MNNDIASGNIFGGDTDSKFVKYNLIGNKQEPMLGDAGYGTFTINDSGYWTYKLNNNHPSVNALNVGNQLQDWTTFLLETDTHVDINKPDVIVSDTLEITVVVTIEGSDDLSIINNEVTQKTITISENQFMDTNMFSNDVITQRGYNKAGHGGFIVIFRC